MNAYVLWLDHEEAKFYELAPGGVRRDHIRRKQLADVTKFFHQVAEYLSPRAGDILLIGPGTAKDQFKHYLEQYHYTALVDRLAAVQSIGHPSDGEVMNVARKFFTHYDAFQ